MHGIKRTIDEFPVAGPRLGLTPMVENASERPQQKVAAAAGRVDHLENALTPTLSRRARGSQAELLDGRLQCPFEDEFLDEHRGLE